MKSLIAKILPILVLLGIVYYVTVEQATRETSEGREYVDPIPSSEHQTQDIRELTREETVSAYVKANGKLPEYYVTKNEARKSGWVASQGNLCEALPGKAIGGDVFGNREGNLPKRKGRIYYEADINYSCGRRNAERLIYSNDGLIFITKDHYNTFLPPQ